MIRGTTPTITLKYKNSAGSYVDLSAYVVWITLQDKNEKQLNFTNARITFNADYSFAITLTQLESLSLTGNKVSIQLRARNEDTDDSIASDIVDVPLNDVLMGGEI